MDEAVDLDAEDVGMGELVRSLSSAYADGCDEWCDAEESFDDLFIDRGDVDCDLFERVGSHADDADEGGPYGAAVPLSVYTPATDPGAACFDEEAEMLSAMYPDCRWNDRHDCFSVQVVSEETLEFGCIRRGKKSRGVVLNILRLSGYPQRAPEVCIEPWHDLLTFDEVHRLYSGIKELSQTMIGTPLLSSIVSHATCFCDAMLRMTMQCDATEETTSVLKEMGVRVRGLAENLSPSIFVGGMGDILSKLPRGLDVINVENVLRPDLALRFERMQRYFFKKYVEKHESKDSTKKMRLQKHILKLADTRTAFHGTRMTNVGKIVRSGLLVPSAQTGIKVATGSRYGQGIYSSPDPELALSYAGCGYEDMNSVKLMVVAVLMGKERVIADGEEPWGGGCTDGYDSHMSEDGRQYVVFHEAQILPCYVLHLMFRSNGERTETTNTHRIERGSHQSATKEQKILTQMARKNLPFGFGPRGSNFVVEEIAPVSDDEEEWGEFQELRGGGHVGHEEFQHETLLPPPPPPAAPKPKLHTTLKNPNR